MVALVDEGSALLGKMTAIWRNCSCEPRCLATVFDDVDHLGDAPSVVMTTERSVVDKEPCLNHALLDGHSKGLTYCDQIEIDNLGSTYVGQWMGTTIHGVGTLTRPDGSTYKGHFEDGEAHGFGMFTDSNGEVYEGQWERDGAHGMGKYFHRDGSTYNGEWFEDEKSGHGTECYSDGSSYAGQFAQGRKHGFGCYTSASGGVIFEGEMRHGKMHGVGTYNFTDGRSYLGEWTNGHMNGQGVLTWPDGSSYSGGMKSDKMHGEGVISAGDTTFAGQWFNGKKVAPGITAEGKSKDSQKALGFLKEGLLEDFLPCARSWRRLGA